jgi:hypothetical protein
MDQKTFLKEMAKHAQRNSTNTKREDSNQKKVQIKTFKTKDDFDRLKSSIDVNSLELFAEMMRDRYGNRNEQED